MRPSAVSTELPGSLWPTDAVQQPQAAEEGLMKQNIPLQRHVRVPQVGPAPQSL